MAHSLTPVPMNPTPTAEQLRARLLRTIESLHEAVAIVEQLPGPQRIHAAAALNCYATPLICAVGALRPIAPDIA